MNSKKILDEISNPLKKTVTQKIEDVKKLIISLWTQYCDDTQYEEADERLKEATDLSYLYVWLEADVSQILISNMSDKDEIRNKIMNVCPDFNFDKCVTNASIRRDFATALRNVKNGWDLSDKIGYSFSTLDLMNLLELHKQNKFRRKIEELLEDCNFHAECGLLSDKKYKKYEELVKNEAA